MLNKQEFGRQIIHLGVGFVVALLYYLDILSPLMVFLIIIIGGLASLISKRIKLPIFNFFLNNFERKEDRKTFPGRGMIFFFIGTLLVMQLFEKDIALAAIMILALGDSVSHLWGRQFGQLKNIFNGNSKKFFEGTLAGFLAGFAGAALFVSLPEAFLASFAAMIVEVVDFDLNGKEVNDNLLVPLAAGTVIFLLRMYV
jgi:phytol kinase